MTKTDPVGQLRLLSLAETCAVLGCSMKTLRRRIADGAIAVIRDGRLIHIHPDDLRALHPAAPARVTGRDHQRPQQVHVM